MKKIIAVMCALVFLFMFVACVNTSEYTLDYGASQMYSKEDIESAAKVVVKELNGFRGCVLYSLSFAGDEVCKEELSYVNDLVDDTNVVYDECMVLYSEFRSPVFGGGAWNANDIYTWSWYLGRENGGKWVLETYGYP